MTRKIFLGGCGKTKRLSLGGGEPVAVQTMWKESIAGIEKNTARFSNLLERIETLQKLGCDILRFAVPDEKSAASLCALANETSMPLVADIHFDYRLALLCLRGNVSVIRINPGNIGKLENVQKVVEACKEKNAAIRIGVNAGSLEKDLAEKVARGELIKADALAESAFREEQVFADLQFLNYAVSIKSSNVQETILANKKFSEKSDTPLHVGVTEAGPLIAGVAKSAIALNELLKSGIGDTVRVSLSDTCENEIIAAREILNASGKKRRGISVISCPRCGRLGFDVRGFLEKYERTLYELPKTVTVAIMGCVVNGPGEAKNADLGIAGSADKAVIFKKGKIIRTISLKDADKVFIEELHNL